MVLKNAYFLSGGEISIDLFLTQKPWNIHWVNFERAQFLKIHLEIEWVHLWQLL